METISVANDYDALYSLKGNVNATTFRDWHSNTEKIIHMKEVIFFVLIPELFIVIQEIMFFKREKLVNGIFTVIASFFK
jgi:hypothetical protein